MLIEGPVAAEMAGAGVVPPCLRDGAAAMCVAIASGGGNVATSVGNVVDTDGVIAVVDVAVATVAVASVPHAKRVDCSK